jgi:hypothetical protein
MMTFMLLLPPFCRDDLDVIGMIAYLSSIKKTITHTYKSSRQVLPRG